MKCPMCDGTGNTVITHGGECDCSYCNGDGEIEDKGLYEVEVSFNMIVWANNPLDAQNVARENVQDELYQASYLVYDDPYFSSDWTNSIPYGDAPCGYEDFTVHQITKRKMELAMALEAKTYVDPNQLSLFEGV